MYITLDVSNYHHYLDDDEKLPNNLPKPDFMPNKLVRISNMTEVDGSQVNEGYCALSYSWNQSGEILHDEVNGEYKRIDEGKHGIISYFKTMWPDMIIPKYKTHDNVKLKKIYEVLRIIYFYDLVDEIKYVKFEGIIQKICQKFNIKYIWYDQMCINQNNREEKHREIRNMHHIYSSAYCTIAFVPDYKNDDTHLGSNGQEYFKRLWTLEEAIKSERLLFVGKDTHRWGEDFSKSSDNTKILNKPLSELNVAQILHHAHQRTSTKEHDRVFALIQLFPEFMQHIDIDYNQPLDDLMIRFYGLLAKKDISILLFRSSISQFPYNSKIQKYEFLPSWTGVNGKHVAENLITSFRNYDIIGKTMHVGSKFVTNGQLIDNDALTIRKEDLPQPPGDINDGYNKLDYYLCISVQLPGSSETEIIQVMKYHSYYDIFEEECFNEISKELKRLSRFVETKKENLYWFHRHREEYQRVICIDFNRLTEDVDNLSVNYIILSEVLFKNEYLYFYYPVIKNKQGEEFYKSIGCCKIDIRKDIFSDCNLPRKTFSIQ